MPLTASGVAVPPGGDRDVEQAPLTTRAVDGGACSEGSSSTSMSSSRQVHNRVFGPYRSL